MRMLLGLVLMAGLAWTAVGCRYGPKPYYEGPTVAAFSGQVLQDGKPVTFPEDEEVIVKFTVIEGDKLAGRPVSESWRHVMRPNEALQPTGAAMMVPRRMLALRAAPAAERGR